MLSSSSAQSDIDDRIRVKFKILLDGYRRMFDRSLSKSKDLGVMLRFLPGVVVQKHMNMKAMADLYRIKPDLLKRFIKFTFELTFEPLKPSLSHWPYILDDYLCGFLRNRDRSQLYYCDPILQHISICCHILSLLDRSNAFRWWVLPANLNPHFLIFDLPVVNSLNTSTPTSMSIYVPPPGVFFIHRTIPTTTLP